jgi:hypothetical protein
MKVSNEIDDGVLLCLKANSMHNVLGDTLEQIETRLGQAKDPDVSDELSNLRAWFVAALESEEIPRL